MRDPEVYVQFFAGGLKCALFPDVSCPLYAAWFYCAAKEGDSMWISHQAREMSADRGWAKRVLMEVEAEAYSRVLRRSVRFRRLSYLPSPMAPDSMNCGAVSAIAAQRPCVLSLP